MPHSIIRTGLERTAIPAKVKITLYSGFLCKRRGALRPVDAGSAPTETECRTQSLRRGLTVHHPGSPKEILPQFDRNFNQVLFSWNMWKVFQNQSHRANRKTGKPLFYGLSSPNVHYSYSIPTSVSPCARAVSPARLRSLAARISGISSGSIIPLPTRSSVPAMMRTIL